MPASLKVFTKGACRCGEELSVCRLVAPHSLPAGPLQPVLLAALDSLASNL